MKNIRMVIRCFLIFSFIFSWSLSRPVQAAGPLLSCRLENSQVNVGGKTFLTIELKDITNLYAYQLEVRFPAQQVSLLDGDAQTSGVNFALGDLLSPDFVALNEVAAGEGRASLGLTQVNPSEPASGSGILARIEVQAQQAGSAAFAFNNVILADAAAQPVGLSVQGCTLQVLPVGEPTQAAQPTVQPTIAVPPPTPADAPAPAPTQPAVPTQPAAQPTDALAEPALITPAAEQTTAQPDAASAGAEDQAALPAEAALNNPSKIQAAPAQPEADPLAQPAGELPAGAAAGLGALVLIGLAGGLFLLRKRH